MSVKFSYQVTTLMLMAVFFIAGCHKDDWQHKNERELLTAGPWKFTRAGLDTNHDGKIDTTIRPDLLPECVFDNEYTFNTDSTAMLDEGNNNCKSGEPRQTSFDWYFMNNESEIFMSIRILPVYESPSKIIELTRRKFVISWEVGVHGYPAPLTFVIVLTR